MYVTVMPSQLEESEVLKDLALLSIMSGISPSRDASTGQVTYTYDDLGERTMTHEQFHSVLAEGVEINKPYVWVEMTTEDYTTTEVPSTLPYSTDDGNARIWSDYAPFATAAVDGTKYLVRCVHVQVGATNGNGIYGDELLLWYDVFGDALLCRTEGETLLHSDVYTPDPDTL